MQLFSGAGFTLFALYYRVVALEVDLVFSIHIIKLKFISSDNYGQPRNIQELVHSPPKVRKFENGNAPALEFIF